VADPIRVSGPISGTDKTLSFETGKLAPQSQGAVVATIGGTTVLTTANSARIHRNPLTRGDTRAVALRSTQNPSPARSSYQAEDHPDATRGFGSEHAGGLQRRRKSSAGSLRGPRVSEAGDPRAGRGG